MTRTADKPSVPRRDSGRANGRKIVLSRDQPWRMEVSIDTRVIIVGLVTSLARFRTTRADSDGYPQLH